MSTDILSTRHLLEPGYADFAVMQVSYTLLRDDLEGLLDETRKLVGEAKFDINASGVTPLGSGGEDPVITGEKV